MGVERIESLIVGRCARLSVVTSANVGRMFVRGHPAEDARSQVDFGLAKVGTIPA